MHLMIASSDTTWPVPEAWLSCFRLMIALRCPQYTSVLLLGNDAAATELFEDAGWAYSNDGTDSTIDGNRLWEIPYVKGDEVTLVSKKWQHDNRCITFITQHSAYLDRVHVRFSRYRISCYLIIE